MEGFAVSYTVANKREFLSLVGLGVNVDVGPQTMIVIMARH